MTGAGGAGGPVRDWRLVARTHLLYSTEVRRSEEERTQRSEVCSSATARTNFVALRFSAGTLFILNYHSLLVRNYEINVWGYF